MIISNKSMKIVIKIIAIGYATVIYFILGAILGNLVNKYILYISNDDIPLYLNVLQILFILWLDGIIIYSMRNIVKRIPFLLNGMYDFDITRLKELRGASTFTFAFFYYQPNLKRKMDNIFKQHTIQSSVSASVLNIKNEVAGLDES